MPQEPKFLSAGQFLLTTLVVKLAAMAALATMLARYRRFRHILIFEQRNWPDRLVFALGLAVPFTTGVAARVLLNYDAADLTLEGAFLAGLIAGPYTGAIVALSMSLPALAVGEYGAPFFAVGCGFAGGGLREACPKEDIWNFSPFVIFSVPRYMWRMLRDMKVNWQVMLLLAPVGLEFIRQMVGARYPLRLFHFTSPDSALTLFVYIATIVTVSTPIKIWNNARIEHRLQEQEKLLLAAKVEALKSQINPHFLFNTLTSVSSLIRSQPDTARAVIQKLSGLLRKLMQNQEQFVSLREELAAIDEYLDIEVIRFGSRLSVRKSIAPDTLDLIVPSLLLQPLVENCIKHGFARKVGPGTITIRSKREGRLAVIEVEDDGLGISDERLLQALSSGIGLSNVHERLRVLYGASGRLALTGSPGKGACARVEIPLDRDRHPHHRMTNAALTAIVADDEQLARDELCFLLGQIAGVEVIGQASNGVEALDEITRQTPDVAFLDVQMPGLTGFEVARRLMESGTGPSVIFVTAFDQRAIEAFEVNAVDYVLKPVDSVRLETAVTRARKRRTQGEPLAGQLDRLVRMMAGQKDRRDQVAVKVNDRFVLVQADDIIHASLVEDSINIVTNQVSGTSNDRTLEELHARLDPDVFWRVHRSHLVNINKVKEIVPWFSRNYILRMTDAKATEIPVSRSQTRRLRDYLKL